MKKFLTTILSIALVFSMCTSVSVAATADTWDGSSDTSWYDESSGKDEYTLTTAEELAGLAELVNRGEMEAGLIFILGANIDLQGKEWTPIGTRNNTFEGSFNGNGYEISNLSINATLEVDGGVGFFGVTNHSEILNLGIVNASVIAKIPADKVDINAGAGILAGMMYNLGAVYNCYSTGSVTLNGEVVDEDTETLAGGLIGYIEQGALLMLHSTATVTGKNFTVAGGLIGGGRTIILMSSYAAGDVTVTGDVGGASGLVGHMIDGGLMGTYSLGDVTSDGNAGGLLCPVVSGNSQITSSYATGMIKGNGDVGAALIEGTYSTAVSVYGNSAVKAQGEGTNGEEYVLGTEGASLADMKKAAFRDKLNEAIDELSSGGDEAEAFVDMFDLDSNYNNGFPYSNYSTWLMSGEGQTSPPGQNLIYKLTMKFKLAEGIKIFINNVEVPLEMLVFSPGSTIVTVSNEYIKELGIGTHDIAFTFDGNLITRDTFTIALEEEEEDVDAPPTGDSTSLFAFMALAAISLAGSAYVIGKKKTRI